jgi:hypothetical protein
VARPIKDGMDYFPHDTDASSDEKIEALLMLYGTKGYTFYFILLERIYRTQDFELDISDEETVQILSRKMTISTEEFYQILTSAIKHKCFDKEMYENKRILTSNGIKKRAFVVVEKRERMRAKYEGKKENISAAETTQETQVETPQSKVKKSKGEKSINLYTHDEVAILELWNSKGIVEHNQIDSMQKPIKNALKKWGKDLIIQAIENYAVVLKDESYFYDHIFRLDKFLKQANALPDFLEQGQQWLNYQQKKGGTRNENIGNDVGKYGDHQEYARILDGD